LSIKAIIFCVHNSGSREAEYNSIITSIKGKPLLIAVDGGADLLFRLGLTPDFIIGDLDSIKPSVLDYFRNRVEIIRYPKEKNETDTELAVEWCVNKGIRELCIINDMRGDLAHTLGVLAVLNSGFTKKLNIRIESLHEIALMVPKKCLLKGKVGHKLSLLPISRVVKGITTSGLAYPLKDEELKYDSCRGLSNLFVDEEVTINYEYGRLIALLDKGERGEYE
jgi:thiamine pyrophosphokinase